MLAAALGKDSMEGIDGVEGPFSISVATLEIFGRGERSDLKAERSRKGSPGSSLISSL